MTPSGPKSWDKGRHGDHEVVIVEVRVCRDAHGRVYSAHDLQSEDDRRIVLEWPGGGLEAVAFALLVEAVRREALLDVLLQLSHDPTFADRFRRLSDDEQSAEVARIGTAAVRGMSDTIARIAADAVREALASVLTHGR